MIGARVGASVNLAAALSRCVPPPPAPRRRHQRRVEVVGVGLQRGPQQRGGVSPEGFTIEIAMLYDVSSNCPSVYAHHIGL